MMKNIYTTAIVALAMLAGCIHATAQEVGLKTNIAYLATSTLNAGLDFKLADKWSGSLHMGYNPWQFGNKTVTWADGKTVDANPKLMHFLVMPEVKWWPCRVFERHAIGLHGIYAAYNVAALPFPKQLKDRRYRGDLYGVGLSWGYQWAIGERSGLELSIGAGYVWTRYHAYEAGACGKEISTGTKGFFAPTKCSLNYIYYLK